MPYTILPIKSVGVQGDGRTYRHAIVLFSEEPTKVTAEIQALATSIPNGNKDINRVLLCVSQSEKSEFHLTPGSVTETRANVLREADAIVDEEMRAAGLYEKIWQFPVVLLPLGTSDGKESIVLRPVESTEAMTANAAPIPEDVLARMTTRLMDIPGIDAVFLDLTNKPPGTIEWE